MRESVRLTLWVLVVCVILCFTSLSNASALPSAGEMSLKYNVTSVKSGDWVRVYYSNGASVAEKFEYSYWIGLYLGSVNVINDIPADKNSSEWSAPYTDPAPIKYHEFNMTGKASLDYYDFIIANHRADLAFWIFEGSIDKPGKRVKGPVLTLLDQTLPVQGRIHRTTDPTEMRVSWTSMNVTGKEAVKWGETALSLTNTVQASSLRYDQTDLCGEPAQSVGYWDPGNFLTAVITGLKPSTNYSYQFGGDTYGWSQVFTFMSAPTPGPDVKQRLLITADMGVAEADKSHYHWMQPDAWATLAGLKTAHNASASDIIVHVGDIAYATGYLAKWDIFMDSIAPMSTEIPYMTGLGNHERDWPGTGSTQGGIDSGGECGIPAQSRFIMPTPNGNQNLSWWSIDHGSIHILMMATELDISVGSAQLAWIEEDLRSVNRSVTPWVVFAGHRPMYTGNTRDPDFGDPLEPLLYKYKVDLCLWGHVHSAEVTYPIFNSTRVTQKGTGGYDAPIHAVIGNGGMTITPNDPGSKADWMAWLPKTQYWGWSDVTAESSTEMIVRLYHNDDNHKEYEFRIEREWPRGY